LKSLTKESEHLIYQLDVNIFNVIRVFLTTKESIPLKNEESIYSRLNSHARMKHM